MLVEFNLKMQRLHIYESTSRGRVPTDYLLSERVFLPKALLQQNEY